jgi:hypothetical protein
MIAIAQAKPQAAGQRTARPLVYLFDLLAVLVARDMKLLYKRSALGVLWTLINPFFQLMVFLFIFQVVVRVDIPHYPSYVFSALLVWQWFSGSMVQAVNIAKENGARDVYMVFIHSGLNANAAERFAALPVNQFITTDTIPVTAEKKKIFGNRLKILSIAPLLGEVIKRAHEGRSVGEMFNE